MSPKLRDKTATRTKVRRPRGRPRRGEAPAPFEQEVVKLLIHGRIVTRSDGSTAITYPGHRELAEQFGVSKARISAISRRHNCMRVRQEMKKRTELAADRVLIERRAQVIAFSRDQQIELVDACVHEVRKAVAEGRFCCNNPGDLNTLLRLRAFLEGGADSRAEVRSEISIEALQARHREALRAASNMTIDVTGRLERDTSTGATAAPAGELTAAVDDGATPPTARIERGSSEIAGYFREAESGHFDAPARAQLRPTGAADGAAEDE